MDCQDWEKVTVRSKKPASTGHHAPAVTQAVAHARRLEKDELPKVKAISNESKQLIIQKRVEHKWNQAQLNAQCAFPANIVRDIEAGKIQPTPHQLNTLSRVLGVVLKYDA